MASSLLSGIHVLELIVFVHGGIAIMVTRLRCKLTGKHEDEQSHAFVVLAVVLVLLCPLIVLSLMKK